MLFSSGLGITAGAHRLWAHKSYKAKVPLRLLLTLFNTIAFQPPQDGTGGGEVGARGWRQRVLQRRGQLLRQLQRPRPRRTPRPGRDAARAAAAGLCTTHYLYNTASEFWRV